ncbi:MAG: sigma-70 family RNA polymerase sigma factor [Planctomycetota bacterium]
MSPTSTSRTLLARVRDSSDAEAWERFFELYAPLLERYARARGLGPVDAEEVRDQCLELVVRRMPTFDYDPGRGRFQRWLAALARGKVVDHLRRRREQQPDTQAFGSLEAPDPGPDELWEESWRREHLRYCLEEARRKESERTFRVFELLLFEGRSAAEVAERTGWTPNQVYKAKHRVLRRVRAALERLGTADGEAPAGWL